MFIAKKGPGREFEDLIPSQWFESLVNEITRVFNNAKLCIDHPLSS